MGKSEIQKEWDKIKETNLIRVKTIQKKHVDQIQLLPDDEYSHSEHVVIGWYTTESFDYVLIKSVKTGHLYRLAIWKYVLLHCKVTGHEVKNDMEYVPLEIMVRRTFDQLFF
jgi:hypothetical protein